MEFIRGLHNLRPRHRGCVATIGKFDGLHLGHHAVLEQLRVQAAALGLPRTVIVFEPQPQEFFQPAHAPARLSRLREKLRVLAERGVERVLCLRFDAALAAMPARAFVQRVLVDGLGVRFLVVGDDFRFGHGREGDFALLVEAGRTAGFDVAYMATREYAGARISSSRVRAALASGDLALAGHLLGRPYAIHGRVEHGAKRGRTIGFPTANVGLHRRRAPVAGVYAVTLRDASGTQHRGVANVGNRPTVDGTRAVLEVHLFDFAGDLYGQAVEVAFRHWLRAERKFASFDELKAQIVADAAAARIFLG